MHLRVFLLAALGVSACGDDSGHPANIDAPHGTAAHVLDCVDQTSFTQVASMLFATVAHS